MLQVLFAEDCKVENLLCSTVSCSKAGLFFSKDVLCLWLQSVKDGLQHDFTWVADVRLPFFGSVMTIDWVQGIGQSPVCQILLQTAARMLVTASPPACINSVGMLSTPADFPFFKV